MPWEVQDVLAEERHIGLVEVQHCVTSSKLRAKDDLKKRRDYISLTFTDFLEAFCRLASRMCFPTQLMLMNLDIPTAWEVHARRRTAKDYNDQKKLQEIDARMRPVVPGEGKLKGMESPLYGEKLRGWVKENWDLEASVPNKVRQLLACLFYPMDPEGFERDGVPRMRRVCTALDRVAPLPKVVRRREDETPD